MTTGQTKQQKFDSGSDISVPLIRTILKHNLKGRLLAEKLNADEATISRMKSGSQLASLKFASLVNYLDRDLDAELLKRSLALSKDTGLSHREFIMACVARCGEELSATAKRLLSFDPSFAPVVTGAKKLIKKRPQSGKPKSKIHAQS